MNSSTSWSFFFDLLSSSCSRSTTSSIGFCGYRDVGPRRPYVRFKIQTKSLTKISMGAAPRAYHRPGHCCSQLRRFAVGTRLFSKFAKCGHILGPPCRKTRKRLRHRRRLDHGDWGEQAATTERRPPEFEIVRTYPQTKRISTAIRLIRSFLLTLRLISYIMLTNK